MLRRKPGVAAGLFLFSAETLKIADYRFASFQRNAFTYLGSEGGPCVAAPQNESIRKNGIMSDEHDNEQDHERGHGVGVVSKTAPKTKRPSLYKVLLLNDDYTPQEFVVWLLQAIFKKDAEDAVRIMLHVHNNGVGVCGVYTYEVAETKVAQVMELSRRNQHPLQCTMERE